MCALVSGVQPCALPIWPWRHPGAGGGGFGAALRIHGLPRQRRGGGGAVARPASAAAEHVEARRLNQDRVGICPPRGIKSTASTPHWRLPCCSPPPTGVCAALAGAPAPGFPACLSRREAW